jgi:hypothetical protein
MTDRLRRPRQVADVGSDDRLAGVRFLTRLPSRTLSRSRYAGRELRLGIVSDVHDAHKSRFTLTATESRRRIHGYIARASAKLRQRKKRRSTATSRR